MTDYCDTHPDKNAQAHCEICGVSLCNECLRIHLEPSLEIGRTPSKLCENCIRNFTDYLEIEDFLPEDEF